jgi:hypothetical protein
VVPDSASPPWFVDVAKRLLDRSEELGGSDGFDQVHIEAGLGASVKAGRRAVLADGDSPDGVTSSDFCQEFQLVAVR